MSSNLCDSCGQGKPVPSCLTTLVIGTIADLTTNVKVFFQRTSTRIIERLDAISDGAGLVSLDVSSIDWLDGEEFKVWITGDPDSLNAKKNITISTDVFECWTFRICDIYNTSGNKIATATHTLETDE